MSIANQSMAQAHGANNPIAIYRTQQVMSSSPSKLVTMVFDHAIASCKSGDGKRASACVAALIDALDFDAGEIATGFFRLYRYCMDCIKKQEFAEALKVLEPLRETWAQATQGQGVE
ncbi:MAG TPA: flagellar protein FliS [Firmicutes bacterium]|nr:flagellar protein FliS [Bacillota bacterium]HHY98912.1 flagellar protein FliS [Bacillota bacterium]